MIDLIKELGEPSKRTILALIKASPKSVTDIVDATGMKQPNVSNHLARMKQKGIVRSSKVGRQVFYSLASIEIAEALQGLVNADIDSANYQIELNEDLVKQFCRSATNGDELECTAIVDRLLGTRHEIIDIYEELFGSSLQLIGTWWQVGAIDVGQEHLASAIVERLMARALHHSAPPKTTALAAVLGCPPGNWHSLGLRMVSDMLRLSGWRSYFLGANVPIDSFISAIREHRPKAVMFSCPIEEQLPEVDELLAALVKYRAENYPFTIVADGFAIIARKDHYLASGVDFIGENLKHFRSGFIEQIRSADDSISEAPKVRNGHKN